MIKSLACISALGLLLMGCATPMQTSQMPVNSTVAEAANNQVSTLALESDSDFSTTLGRLEQALISRDLTIFDMIDHSGGAATVGLELAPTTLVIFGNPKVGTPLMQEDIRMGLELPMKMLVYQTGDKVYVAWGDFAGRAANYGFAPDVAPMPKISETLALIAADAAGDVGLD